MYICYIKFKHIFEFVLRSMHGFCFHTSVHKLKLVYIEVVLPFVQ